MLLRKGEGLDALRHFGPPGHSGQLRRPAGLGLSLLQFTTGTLLPRRLSTAVPANTGARKGKATKATMHNHDVVTIPKTTPFVKSLLGEHYCVGNDLDQSTSRQFQQIAEMVRRNSYLSARARVDKKRLEFLPTGSTILALAQDAVGNSGGNHLGCSHTESWGIIYIPILL